MADSWEDEDFDLPSAAPPITVPASWDDEVRMLFDDKHYVYSACRHNQHTLYGKINGSPDDLWSSVTHFYPAI